MVAGQRRHVGAVTRMSPIERGAFPFGVERDLSILAAAEELGVLAQDGGGGIETVDDHIEQNPQAKAVGRIDELAQIGSAAVGRVNAVKIERGISSQPMRQALGQLFEPAGKVFGEDLEDDRVLHPGW